MAVEQTGADTMRTLRFHEYGEPADVLRLEKADAPEPPAPAHIRVQVHACGLNPADWALCRGLFFHAALGSMSPGIVGGRRRGRSRHRRRRPGASAPPAFANYPSAGASDFAVLERWGRAPDGLDLVAAAALPMAVETASLPSLDFQRWPPQQTVLIHAAGTMMGFAAVQMALMRGARVIATPFLRRTAARLFSSVTSYGDGMVERVREIMPRQAGPDPGHSKAQRACCRTSC